MATEEKKEEAVEVKEQDKQKSEELSEDELDSVAGGTQTDSKIY